MWRGIVMYRNVLILALILISYPSFANGEAKKSDGNELLKFCNMAIAIIENNVDKINSLRLLEASGGAGYCVGVIKGIGDMHNIYTVWFKIQNRIFCVPEEVNIEQQARVVIKFLKDNPAILHEHNTILIVKALKNAYPCKAN